MGDSDAGIQVDLPDVAEVAPPAPPPAPKMITIQFDPLTKKAILASLTMVALYAMFKAR